ncbi:APC family permease [Hoeflea sp. TYP-13]|uniref:APC family permease n=1 Tax=Hoeflea sp. TYP-13 TaxID=3230023 RepID=UPI0034C5D0E0
MSISQNSGRVEHAALKRTLTLPYVVFYGLGVTVGAGIYVLIGEVIARAGNYAPVSFLIAGLVMVFPAACYAELTGRLPYAAAEAHFVEAGFRSKTLFLIVGLAVASVGIVSSAAIAHGAVGYISQITDLPPLYLLVGVILATGLVAGFGVRESIAFAGLLTLIEVSGLVAIVVGSAMSGADLVGQAREMVPQSFSTVIWFGIVSSSLLAFFAFIGFEDIPSIAEETVNPQKTLSRGIFITLILSLLIYVAVAVASLAAVPAAEITATNAPLALVFSKTTGLSPLAITLIAIIATVNGIIVQILMAARVLYGLANRGSLPRVLAYVDKRTRAPIAATGVATGTVLVLALTFPITRLAESTSVITLIIFATVCAALIRIKRSGAEAPAGTFIVPVWIPYCGIVACLTLLISGILAG